MKRGVTGHGRRGGRSEVGRFLSVHEREKEGHRRVYRRVVLPEGTDAMYFSLNDPREWGSTELVGLTSGSLIGLE